MTRKSYGLNGGLPTGRPRRGDDDSVFARSPTVSDNVVTLALLVLFAVANAVGVQSQEPLTNFKRQKSALAALPNASSASRPARGSLDPLFYRDAVLGAAASLREREIVQMLSAVASGSQMGPGEGWFHPGKGRYDWKWLAARYDANRDGRITPEEFKGPRALFDRLDRDRNGMITRDDLDWSESSPYMRTAGMVG